MKIWIVASDPFLDDFEKMAKRWPQDTVVYITTLTKYGYGIFDFFSFLKKFIEIKPEAILTDHGYPGFALIRLLSILHRVKIIFFLRGNYWLEEKTRNSS